ncbi:hypothetical protein BGW41_006802 [Actinomortierella wolfii]|nr:hypothetical protein BGW41_006802 [Actinomortierella wolfii]
MDTESFRQGKGFWGIGKYSWTITVQARSNGKKYVIKRVAKSLLPPEAYYRYPTTAHRLCTCPACKSRREQLLQSGQIDPKDVEEVLALQYSNNSNNGGGNNLITNVNGNGRGHRRDQSLLTRLSQPSSPSASSSNLNLLGLGGIKATTLLTNKEKKRNSGGGGSANGGSILPLQRASTMSPSRFFGSASGYKSGSSTPQGTPIHSRPATPMMTPLSRPGTPSASATLSNAHKSSHTGHNTPNHPNNNNNNNNNNSGSTLVVNTSTPNIQLSQTNHDQGDVAEVKHSRSKSHATPSSSLRLGSSSASHRPPALNLFTRTPSQDKVAQTINTSSSLLSPVSPYHSKSFAQELENSIPIPLRGAEQRSQLSSPPPSQRASLENPSDSSLKSLQHKGLESVQAGRLLEMRASVSTTAIHTSEGAGENGGKEVSEVEPSNPVLLPSLVLDTDRQPSHSHHLSTVSSSFSPSRIERGPPGLKKKEGASRPGLRRVASTPSLSRARTGLDALDEDPLVVQLRAATHYPLSKPSARTTSYNDSWRQNGIPKVQVTPSEEKSSFSLSSRGSHGRVFGQDDGDALDKNTRDSGIEDDRIFKLDDDHYDDEQRHQQHHPSLRKIIHFQHGAEEEDSEEDDSADEAWIAPGRAQEEYPSPVRSLTPSAAVNAAAAAAALAGLSLPPSTSIAIQQPNYVPPPHSLPMELVLLQTYNDSDHLPEHHEWTQDQDYWYYVTKAHGVKRPKLKKISSWWTDAIGGSLIAATGGGNGNTGGSGGAGGGGSGIGPRPLLTPPPSSSSSSSHGLSTTTESMAIGPVFHMSMSPVSFAGASSATGGQKHLDHHGSSAHTTTNTSLTNGQEDRTSNDGQNNSSSSGDSSSNSNSNSNNSSKSSSNNTLAVPGQGGGERFLNVHGLASDVSLISLDSNGYVYNNYSSTPNNKSNMPWTKRHGSPRQYHSSKYYYVDWDEYISL